MTNLLEKEVKAITEAIEAMDKKVILDSHDNKPMKIDGYVVLDNGSVCPLLAGKFFCLNGMYISDGEVVLSQMSVAGNIDARNRTLDYAVRVYIEEQSKFIPHIVSYKVFNN